jgi:predicted RNase H-like HicB family nuclease
MTERYKVELTILLEEAEGGWFTARIEEYPEVITGAPSRDEARILVLDALKEYLLACAETGEPAVVMQPAGTSR